MANETLKEQRDLIRETLSLQDRLIAGGEKYDSTLADRAGHMQEAVAFSGDNVKLGEIQNSLMAKSNDYAKKNHTILAEKYKTTALTVTKQIASNKIQEEEAKINKKIQAEAVKQADAVNKIATSMTGIFGVAGGILGVFTQFNKMTAAIGKNFGALGMTNKEFKNDLLDAGAEAASLGQNIENVASISKDLTDNFGFSRDESVDMARGVMDTSMALGLSNEEGTKLLGTLMQVSGMSFDTAQNFSKQVALLADIEGVSPTTVMRDIAKSSQTFAKFTSMTPDALAKAAIQATKLGTSLDNIATSMEGMLNFQDSLNAEIEASIMLGRNVNLQKARELALAGEAEAFAVEITKQVGSQSEFEKMNVLQRQSLAKALNMNVEQLAKMVTNQDKVRTIGDAIAEQDGLEKMIGRNAMDGMAAIVADLKRVGAELVISIGPMVANVAGGIASFTKSLSESKVLIPAITALMGAMLGKSVLNFAFSIATMLGKQAAFMGPLGIGFALGIPAIVGGMVSAMMQFKDLPKGQAATLTQGSAIFDEGETVAHTEDLKSLVNNNSSNMDKLEQQQIKLTQEVTGLRQDMASYLSAGGSAIRGITGGFQETVQNA